MDVSDVLRDRARPASGMQRMAAASLFGHLAVVALIVVAPGRLGGAAPEPKTVMTISLGGGVEGPNTGGMTAIGGREVQQATPPDAKPEPPSPAAAATPTMTLPERGKPSKTPTTTIVKNAPADARGRTLSRGAETVAGTSVIETGARGQGFGLSSSGGRGGSGITTDVDFCCPDYLLMMRDRIQQNVNLVADISANVIIRFSIERDGTLKDPYVEKRSGIDRLDIAAQSAIVKTKQIQPLPAAYTNPSLVVHLTFEYRPR